MPQKDSSIVFEAEVPGREEIKLWVMSWGAKALIFEPDSLTEEASDASEGSSENVDETSVNEFKKIVEG